MPDHSADPSGNWWMFHGDAAHTGEVRNSSIDSASVSRLRLVHSLQVSGSILSTPAVVDGHAYVGLANSLAVAQQNGGQFLKVELSSGETVASYQWAIDPAERDTHGFCGMGCTPAVADGRVYFSAFDGKLYCLRQDTLEQLWVLDLRYADPAHNQPVTNDSGDPKAAGWSSPVVAGGRVYLGMGEGENPDLYGFVYCVDAGSGQVIWIFCTCQYQAGVPNQPNQLPLETIRQQLPPGFTSYDAAPLAKGASVWSGIAYDPELNRLYCSTGNPQPDGALPTPGYTNSVLVLDAGTGNFVASVQIPAETSYRASDIDVDIGGAPTLWTIGDRKVVGIGCKNGCYLIFDAHTFEILATRQLLPYYNDGSQIPTVDPHGIDDPSTPYPQLTNEESNATQGENYSGTYSTAALCTPQGKLFIGIGGNNYHYLSPGIDSSTTPFLRALDWQSLAEAWPLDGSDPRRYAASGAPDHPLYKMAGESGISVPAVANDVVFMATTRVALYAFAAEDGRLLWADTENFGPQTGGMSGGYGYCMGPAIAGDYVVAGALVQNSTGGVLNIYAVQG